MSKTRPSPEGEAAATRLLMRPHHGHQSSKSEPDGRSSEGVEVAADPHPNWLRKWRSLRADFDGRGASVVADEKARDLQNNIAHTPAGTLAGLQAQAELISELAWNDVVASTARQLLAGIKRLRRAGAD